MSACRGLRSHPEPCIQRPETGCEKDGSPSSRPHSTLTWRREIKALARLQVKPERLQEDGSRPCPQSVATSALGGASGASGGCDHREGSEVRGVVLGAWRVRAPVGSSSRCCRPRPVRPPTSFPQGSRWSRWGERALPQGLAGPSQGGGAPARPQAQRLHPQRSADILGVTAYVLKGQWLCSKVSLML